MSLTEQLRRQRRALLAHVGGAATSLVATGERSLALHDCRALGCALGGDAEAAAERHVVLVGKIHGFDAGRLVIARDLLATLMEGRTPVIVDWQEDASGLAYRLAEPVGEDDGPTLVIAGEVRMTEGKIGQVGARPLATEDEAHFPERVPLQVRGEFGLVEAVVVRTPAFLAQPSGEPDEMVRLHDGDLVALYPEEFEVVKQALSPSS
ncbi:MAG TPA: hypothetical protein VGD77_17405 [Gemmatimonadaceae bacterium]